MSEEIARIKSIGEAKTKIEQRAIERLAEEEASTTLHNPQIWSAFVMYGVSLIQ